MKVAAIGSMVGKWARDAVLDELKKCELVCANCHVMRTVARARRTIAEEALDDRFEAISAA
ncbi:MAG: hypothetical protein M3P16_05445 [Chloroflexota bacterium]|nr:hypothetical protein [Chloroflexota bacterium]